MNEEKKHQAVELGRLGWSLRQIQKAIGVRCETISVYPKAAGVAMRAPRGQIIPAKPASQSDEVSTDSGGESATLGEARPDPRPGREPEVHGLVAFMEIQASRSRTRARVTSTGELVLLFDQNRTQWDQLLTSCAHPL